MAVDYEKLNAGLGKLRGLDFQQAESEVRRNNATVVMVTTVNEFQARLAAMALEVPYEDIAEMPLKEYNRVTQEVFNFLFSSSGDETDSKK